MSFLFSDGKGEMSLPMFNYEQARGRSSSGYQPSNVHNVCFSYVIFFLNILA